VEFRVYQDRLSALSARFNLMVVMVLGLLMANIVLASLAWFTSYHRQIEVTPFFGGEGYQKSAATIDAHYLGLMSQNFIYSRLNVTPETVSANYERLLTYVDGASSADVMKHLNQEAKIIKLKKISSHFVITDIKLDIHQLTAEMSGILERHVGLRAIPSEQLTYLLTYRYRLGQLTLLSFTQLKQKESLHA
jgi:conjugal transfer pilus assembly protein TraE